MLARFTAISEAGHSHEQHQPPHAGKPKKKKKSCNIVLSYACEVWAVDKEVGKSAEQLHRQILKHVLGVRGSTANPIVLAEFGRYPLRFNWWQQSLRNRINNLPDDERLIQCAFVKGLHDQAYCLWSHRSLESRHGSNCSRHCLTVLRMRFMSAQSLIMPKTFIDRLFIWLTIK